VGLGLNEGSIEKKRVEIEEKEDEGRVDETICKEGWMKDKEGNCP